jgi:hypothetical protein
MIGLNKIPTTGVLIIYSPDFRKSYVNNGISIVPGIEWRGIFGWPV